MHAAIQRCAKSFGCHGTNAAEAFGDCIGAQEDHRANFRFAQRRSDAYCVTAHQIRLELADLIAGDTDRSHFSEAGVYAVSSFARSHQAIDHGARGVHALSGFGG